MRTVFDRCRMIVLESFSETEPRPLSCVFDNVQQARLVRFTLGENTSLNAYIRALADTRRIIQRDSGFVLSPLGKRELDEFGAPQNGAGSGAIG